MQELIGTGERADSFAGHVLVWSEMAVRAAVLRAVAAHERPSYEMPKMNRIFNLPVYKELVDASENMLDAVHRLWYAYNKPPDRRDTQNKLVEEAEKEHSDAFVRLQRAVCYAKAIEFEAFYQLKETEKTPVPPSDK
jgi:hypothetical protein